jgi:hypothetical protein
MSAPGPGVRYLLATPELLALVEAAKAWGSLMADAEDNGVRLRTQPLDRGLALNRAALALARLHAAGS